MLTADLIARGRATLSRSERDALLSDLLQHIEPLAAENLRVEREARQAMALVEQHQAGVTAALLADMTAQRDGLLTALAEAEAARTRAEARVTAVENAAPAPSMATPHTPADVMAALDHVVATEGWWLDAGDLRAQVINPALRVYRRLKGL